jgi:hypothetical protein
VVIRQKSVLANLVVRRKAIVNVQDKINLIFAHLNELEQGPTVDTQKVMLDTHNDERTKFTESIRETIASGMPYEEAVIRVKMSDFKPEDKNIILASIGDLEVKLARTASANNQEVVDMDPIASELKRIAEKMPEYGRWLKETLSKKGFLGTGEKAPEDAMAKKVVTEDESKVKETISEEEKRMKRDDKRTDPDKRTSEPTGATSTTKSAASHQTEKHVANPGKDLRESDRVDSNKWDKDGIKKDLDYAKDMESSGKSRDSKDTQRKNDSVVRASDKLDIKFAEASNSWIISEKASGELLVKAHVDDILGGNEIDAQALKEVKSSVFGDMLKEDIDKYGLEVTAQNLLGEAFVKAAETSAPVKTAAKDDYAQRYFVLRGMFSTLKKDLTKIASNKAVAFLIKKAEDALDKTEESINMEEVVPEVIDTNLEDAAGDIEAVVTVSDMASDVAAPEDVQVIIDKLSPVIPNELKADFDALVQKATEASDDVEGTKPLDEIKKDEEVVDEEIVDEAKEEDAKIDEAKEDTEESKDDAGEGFPFGKGGSAIKNALKKFASKDSKDYDVTPKDNFMAMFEHNKGNITMDGKKFMTIDELKKAFEALLKVKGTEKGAAVLGQIIKNAEKAKASGISEKEYLMGILGDADYVNEYLSKKTPEGINSVWKANTSDTANVYASAASKMKTAYSQALLLQKKGMIGSTTEALDNQIQNFMQMDDNSFKAFAASVEGIAPTTELSEGRFGVKKMAKADKDGNVIAGSVDGLECCYMNGMDVESDGGIVTKANLENALSLVKRAFEEGALEEALSKGKVMNTPGVDLQGLNIGQESKPVLNARDFNF